MNPKVWVAENAEAAMREEADRYPEEETGGVLLGYWRNDELVITGAVGPGPAARRALTRFTPDTDWQAEEVARNYAKSGRTVSYLGDWHTHPRGLAKLSRRDRRTLGRIARSPQARQPRPVMGLLAPDARGELVVWGFNGRFRAPAVLPWSPFR